jgi:hypothetical protein
MYERDTDRNSLLQKRIIYPKIMNKENHKLPKMLRIFCYARMNLKNKEHHLQRSIIAKQLQIEAKGLCFLVLYTCKDYSFALN